ncbi:hypothetical protein LCGC14_1143540 [marine sediment metagenome]|uniref:Uncharacterized protein n=1 Tax=marine sediment metagenome TaxID=412755 RepID=A0A0F9MKN0_9ZZZZ
MTRKVNKSKTMPVPVNLEILREIDRIADQAFLSRTKIVDLILRQFIFEPQYRRSLIVLGSGPKTTYGRSLDAPIEPGQNEPDPLTAIDQEKLVKDQRNVLEEMGSEMTAGGLEIGSYIDPFPDSPTTIDKTIIIRHHGSPAEYEFKEMLTKKGIFTTHYKEAVRKYYGDPDLTFKSMDTLKDRRDHITQHLVSLILRGLVKNTRPTSEDVETHREKENWEQYVNSNGEFSDVYVDALITYFRTESTYFNVDELNQVVDKQKHIKTFLPKLREKSIAI